ncbi:hypothetical protein K2173_023067 [Erythroxylum novogranatense]|uniref:Transmembrane protein n=1 Tax=Erythroxylum novogranatense TaxID=1862640 RepID=A0AAV8T9U3_9ROSI|nr:hypothetical protein K2173_023067 [Erythroxylum novogranatense]
MSASKEVREEEDQRTANVPSGLTENVLDRYRKLKEHAETYPYVWASYIVVYGGLGLWFTYRWRKLRKTEDRVRALQEQLCQLAENEEHANSASSIKRSPPITSTTGKVSPRINSSSTGKVSPPFNSSTGMVSPSSSSFETTSPSADKISK